MLEFIMGSSEFISKLNEVVRMGWIIRSLELPIVYRSMTNSIKQKFPPRKAEVYPYSDSESDTETVEKKNVRSELPEGGWSLNK